MDQQEKKQTPVIAGSSIDWQRAKWRKTTYSDSGACVEVARLGAVIGVRDTKADGHGPVLEFNHAEWTAFLAGVRDGEFELDELEK